MTTYSDEYFTNPDGLKQYYRDYNTAPKGAPTVLCMPGVSRNSRDFSELADYLSSRCRVICVDQRGRGNSEWDPDPDRYRPDVYVADMMALLAHIEVKQVISIGTSLGGLMTMMMAAMHPGILKAAVINDIGPEIDPRGLARIAGYLGKGTPPETWADAVALVKAGGTAAFPTFTDDDWEWFTHKHYVEENGKVTVQYDPDINKNFDKTATEAPMDLWAVFGLMAIVPTLVLRGELSDILAQKTLDKMARTHPDLTPVLVKDRGHTPLMDEPESLAAIDDLLEKAA